jgi:glutathione synthase/RimK-type ligase-like ATP-grasp enzyme
MLGITETLYPFSLNREEIYGHKSEAIVKQLESSFGLNVQLFEDHPNLTLQENINDKKIGVSWG